MQLEGGMMSQASVKVTAAQISWDLAQAQSRREYGAPAAGE